jgi:hypothetical protein
MQQTLFYVDAVLMMTGICSELVPKVIAFYRLLQTEAVLRKVLVHSFASVVT